MHVLELKERLGLTAEQEAQDRWANRTSLLLGDYGKTPVPIPGTGVAAQ